MKTSTILSLAALLACSCVTVPQANTVEASVAVPTYAHQLTVTADIMGELVHRGDCLAINNIRNGQDYLAIWPEGTRFDGYAVGLVLPDQNGSVFQVGNTVRFSGTFDASEELNRLPKISTFRARCSLPVFFVGGVRSE